MCLMSQVDDYCEGAGSAGPYDQIAQQQQGQRQMRTIKDAAFAQMAANSGETQHRITNRKFQ